MRLTDGVIAIMVLEMKVPQGADLAALKSSAPILLVYALNYVNVAIFCVATALRTSRVRADFPAATVPPPPTIS